MQALTYFLVLLCVLYSSATALTWTATLPANSVVRPTASLRFVANEPFDPDSLDCSATGCRCFGVVSGQTATVTFYTECPSEPIPMVITANDLDGNAGNISITYIHDAVVPTFGSYFVEYSSLKANTRLSFSASEPIQPTSLVFEAAGCTLANPTYISQTLLTVNVVSCEDQGDFAITLSAADTVGNVGTATFNYVIDSVAPTITTVYPPPMNLIYRNTAITLSTSEAIRVKSTRFVATGCSFTTPTWTGTVVSTTVLSCHQGGVNLTVFVTATWVPSLSPTVILRLT